MAPWGDANVSEVMQLQEAQINYPSASAVIGGNAQPITLQRSGFLKRLRFLAQAQIDCTVFAAATTRSIYGFLGGYINNLRIDANGKTTLVSLSGLGITMHNEIQNRDGSVLSPGVIDAVNNSVVAATSLELFPNVAAALSYVARSPFEFNFALPVKIRNQMVELGLWMLQDQAIDVNIQCTFNPMYSVLANLNSLWHTAAGNTVAANVPNSWIQIEREMYTIPREKANYPDLGWAHQVVEYRRPIAGGQCRFDVPRSGLLLKASTLTLGATGVPVDVQDITRQSWVYGANETPISRPGAFFVDEFLQDFDRYPMAGLTLMDFYKWGEDGLKFVKNTDGLANLRIETNYAATVTGTQVIVLDELVPVGAK